ncbi:Protein of unknown function (DUF3068) [Branchiibius hedensis]|uniref:DUF3068 domain-containing protein n=1 Tax=Branchiibius hedensis TaxID=672460 RepID=A0A2Y8ZUU4_9MICO|nr:DUF3068 domain-containing protein [Branchiibius hedensis]PWJ25265.1 Protein of unknown function (DUF3068) [Branchiibius hedensis]SSA34079.1 Protein of unknown function [Branchiibius hedensis]
MLRKLALPFLIGLGAFLVVMALGLKFWAPNKLAIIPLDQNTRQVLDDKDAKFFDADTLSYKEGTVTTTLVVAGDKAASEKLGDNKVILNKWQVTDNNNTPPPMDANTMTYAVDRNSGLPVAWDGTTVDDGVSEPTHPKIEGYTIKFPFGTEKKTYQYWDTTLNKTMDMKYVSTESINGLQVYKFEGTVPETTFRMQEVPGSIFGLGASSAGQNAERTYANTRIIWVEPQTGVFIKVSEHQIQEFKIPGHDPALAINTTQVMTPATVKENTDYWGQKAFLLKVLHIMPWILGPLGVLTLIGAPLVSRLLNRRDEEDYSEWSDGVDDDDDRSARRVAQSEPEARQDGSYVHADEIWDEEPATRAERRGGTGDDTIELRKK